MADSTSVATKIVLVEVHGSGTEQKKWLLKKIEDYRDGKVRRGSVGKREQNIVCMYKLSLNLISEEAVDKTYQVRTGNVILLSLEYTIEC